MAGLSSIVNLGYHGTSPAIADAITASGFTGSKVPTWAGTGKTFTSPNINVAQRYGPRQLGVVSSARNLTSPIGGGIGQGGISFGKEVVTNPAQATKGMNLYNKLISGTYATSPLAKRLLETGTTAIKNPTNWARMLGVPLSALTGILSSTPVNAGEQEWLDMMHERQFKNYGPWTHKQQKYKRMSQAKKQAAMQQRIRQHEAAQQVQQVQQNIQTYGNRDRPNTGMNVPGGGKGQSPTGGDVAGTPFVRGGIVDLYRHGGF
jgi:hypothetical protein